MNMEKFLNDIKIQSENDKNIRYIKAELIQKKYGSSVNVNDFFNTNELSNYAEKINPEKIETFCEEDCTIIKVNPTKTENKTVSSSKKLSESEIIYFEEYSEKVGYKSFQYYFGGFDTDKLILTNLNDEQIILIGQDMNDEIKKIKEML